MSFLNPLNVYKGQDGLCRYFDPDSQPLLPLIELPEKLNPFHKEDVRIYAKMMTVLPTQNVKALPALNMLLHDPSSTSKSIIEPSSGSTVTSLAMSARVLHNNCDTTALISNKTEKSRLQQLQFFGIKVALYGGPAQPEITDPRGIISQAHKMAERNPKKIVNPGQYENEHNWRAHIRWTGPQLWKQIPEMNVFCMGMGSAGCITGTGMFLKSQKPSIKVVGVCNAVNDPVPGPRPFPLLNSCEFPWREVVDSVETCSSVDSYRLSMYLSRDGLVAGPSSGMALKGLFDWLQKIKDTGELDKYREPGTKEVNCVFVCCDLPQQYLEGYFSRLGEEEFLPIQNRELSSYDLDKYDLKWELPANEAVCLLSTSKSNNVPILEGVQFSSDLSPTGIITSGVSNLTILDLRAAKDYNEFHVPEALSTPLQNLSAATPDPLADFTKTDALLEQWTNLKAKFSGHDEQFEKIVEDRRGGPLIVLCYNGETSRIATAILRARGLKAFSVKGGMQVLSGYSIT